MRILQLCYKPPFPPCDGGTLAMNSVTQGLLAAGHEVKVLSVSSKKHPADPQKMSDGYLRKTQFESVFVDLDIHPLGAAVALLCGESYNVKRFISKEFEKKLIEILEEKAFDIVHFESIFLAPYLATVRNHSSAACVLRAHNVEHLIWRQMALGTKNALKRWYLKKLALSLRMYELELVDCFDGIACITDDDAQTFRNEGCRKPIIDIPFGVDINDIAVSPDTDNSNAPTTLKLYHLGAMDWLPNQDGIRWFLHEVWPLLHKQLPQATIHLAGRKMPDEFMQLNIEGVTVYGEVPDAAAFMADKQINIVPLLSGSGLRIKIIEAMAHGKTVVTTSVGAAGLKCTDGKDILIADTPQQFVSQLQRCAEKPELLHTVGNNARRLIADCYNNEKIIEQLVSFYNKIQKKPLSEQ